MSVTISDLRNKVDGLNETYTKHSRVMFDIDRAYGGFQVVLKTKPKYKFDSRLGSGEYPITSGHDSARNTINNLYRYNNNWKHLINYYGKKEIKR